MYHHIIYTILLCSLTFQGFAQRANWTSKVDYIERYQDIAIQEMDRSGIPASITLAQGMLESSHGNSKLSKNSNNHFGIKCKKEWKGKRYKHYDDDYDKNGRLIHSCFRVYNSPEDSYQDHTDFLLYRSRYAFLFDYPRHDYKSWAHGLKKAGYATDPKYAYSLIKTIEEFGLYRFDDMSYQPLASTTYRPKPTSQAYTQFTTPPATYSKPATSYSQVPTTNVKPSKPPKVTIRYYPAVSKPPVTKPIQNKKPSNRVSTTAKPKKNLPKKKETKVMADPFEIAKPYVCPQEACVFPTKKNTLFTINGLKTTSAEKTTAADMAKRYGIRLNKFLKYNDLKAEDKLIDGQYLFLKKKKKSFTGDLVFHTVKKNENMYSIAQLYGIQLKALYKRNQLEMGQEPAVGEVIKLQMGKVKYSPKVKASSK